MEALSQNEWEMVDYLRANYPTYGAGETLSLPATKDIVHAMFIRLGHAVKASLDLTKQTELALKMDDACYRKAKERGEQTFTLVAQDRSSPRVICEWIKENIETAPEEKLVDALLDAIAMRSNPNRKSAD